MTDPATGVMVWCATVLVVALALSLTATLSIPRDPDWWVLLRGIAAGKRAQLRRLLRGDRRG